MIVYEGERNVIVYEGERNVIGYKPVCSDWQKQRCKLLGLEYIMEISPPIQSMQQLLVPVSKCPSATARISD